MTSFFRLNGPESLLSSDVLPMERNPYNVHSVIATVHKGNPFSPEDSIEVPDENNG